MKKIIAALLLAATSVCATAAQTTIEFSSITWLVKDGANLPPGRNDWSARNVFVDGDGFLHLKITYDQSAHAWDCAEVISQDKMHYGTYRFYLQGRPDRYDKNAVLGLFLYQSDVQEADIEFSQWGGRDPAGSAQYVIQPDVPDHKNKFVLDLDGAEGSRSTHSMRWGAKDVDFQSFDGRFAEAGRNHLIHRWSAAAPRNPSMDSPKLEMALYLFKGRPPSDGGELELVVTRVEILPDE